ncbi:MAG: type III glutamate--ammonia ligase, partial [Mycobacterium sp.]
SPSSTRFEYRHTAADMNPYLAIAAALGAGIDGIKRSADPGGVGSQGRSALPPTLLHAVDELEGDPVVTGALDAAGEGVAAYFASIKRDEFFAYHSAVTPWEIDQYLTAF